MTRQQLRGQSLTGGSGPLLLHGSIGSAGVAGGTASRRTASHLFDLYVNPDDPRAVENVDEYHPRAISERAEVLTIPDGRALGTARDGFAIAGRSSVHARRTVPTTERAADQALEVCLQIGSRVRCLDWVASSVHRVRPGGELISTP